MQYLVAAGQLKNVSASSSMPKDMLTKELTKLKLIAGRQKTKNGTHMHLIHVQFHITVLLVYWEKYCV